MAHRKRPSSFQKCVASVSPALCRRSKRLDTASCFARRTAAKSTANTLATCAHPSHISRRSIHRLCSLSRPASRSETLFGRRMNASRRHMSHSERSKSWTCAFRRTEKCKRTKTHVRGADRRPQSSSAWFAERIATDVSIVAHGGFINGLLAAIGRPAYPLPTGGEYQSSEHSPDQRLIAHVGILPVVIKQSKS